MKTTLIIGSILAISIAAFGQAPATPAPAKPAAVAPAAPKLTVVTPKNPDSTLKLQLAVQTRKVLQIEEQQFIDQANALLKDKAAKVAEQESIITEEMVRIRKENNWPDTVQWDPSQNQFVETLQTPSTPAAKK